MMVVGQTTQRFGGLVVDIYNRMKSNQKTYSIKDNDVDIDSLFNDIIKVYHALVSYGEAMTNNENVVQLAIQFGFCTLQLSGSQHYKFLIMDSDTYILSEYYDEEYEEE